MAWHRYAERPDPGLLPPPIISDFDPPMGPVPGLGEHTEKILAEVGIDETQLADLRVQGAVGPAYER